MSKKPAAKSTPSKATHSIFKRIPEIQNHDARIELGRAHLLVALLAFALCLMLVMTLQPSYSANPPLTITASILLLVVGLFSFAVAVRLYVHKQR